jgi:hypothetical protein
VANIKSILKCRRGGENHGQLSLAKLKYMANIYGHYGIYI